MPDFDVLWVGKDAGRYDKDTVASNRNYSMQEKEKRAESVGNCYGEWLSSVWIAKAHIMW